MFFDFTFLALLLFVILPLYFVAYALSSPLRRVPAAHPLARFSSLWILWKRFWEIENATIKKAHEKLGPVVLLGPNEVSVNCVKGGLSTVYAGGMEKPLGRDGWYSRFANYDIPNMFATAQSKPHSQRKRMLSNIYSKSLIQASVPLVERSSIILHKRLFPLLRGICDSSSKGSGSPASVYQIGPGVCNMYYVINGLTMDIVTSYIFGLASSSHFTDDPAACIHFLDLYNSRHKFGFWGHETPVFMRVMGRLGLKQYFVPDRVNAANDEIEEWTLSMVNGSRKIVDGGAPIKDEDTPIVYQQLRAAIEKDASKSESTEAKNITKVEDDRNVAIASELLDHHAAGFDTSGITLTYLVHELSLSHNQNLQHILRTELLTLSPPILDLPGGSNTLPDAKDIDNLPFLEAVMRETLRLHAAIPGPQPRETPAGGCTVGPGIVGNKTTPAAESSGPAYFIPGGVRISANAYSLHSNPSVFPEPFKFKPERWMVGGEERKEMDRWFWAFGSGGRMCVGSNLAIYQMKLIVTAIYSNYTTHIVDDEGIEQEDSYTARPRGKKLIIKLERIEH